MIEWITGEEEEEERSTPDEVGEERERIEESECPDILRNGYCHCQSQ